MVSRKGGPFTRRETSLGEEGEVEFLVEFRAILDGEGRTSSMDWSAWRVISFAPSADGMHLIDGTKSEGLDYSVDDWASGDPPVEDERYVNGFIKFDGCSHWEFDAGKDCMLHLCGEDEIQSWVRLNALIFKVGRELMGAECV